jgi:hypothetical protein
MSHMLWVFLGLTRFPFRLSAVSDPKLRRSTDRRALGLWEQITPSAKVGDRPAR